MPQTAPLTIGAPVPGQVAGTTTNDNAAAGNVGEYLSANTLTTAASNGVALNATSLSLTAGDWDVTGIVQSNPAGTTTTNSVIAGISLTSGTFGTVSGGINNLNELAGISPGAGIPLNVSAPVTRVSLAAPTTVYLIGQVGFAVSTLTVSGFIRARRVR